MVGTQEETKPCNQFHASPFVWTTSKNNEVTGTKIWSQQVMVAPLCELFDNDDDNFPVKVKVLHCDYWNRGYPDNVNQSQGRTETKDSNIFKSSQSNVGYRQWNLNLFVDRKWICDNGANYFSKFKLLIF